MGMIIEGRAWIFGNDISTDFMAPGAYQWCGWEELKPHVLEAANPDFPKLVREGDVIIAGRNFGCGSSREKAPRNLMNSGIRCIVAESFGRLFFRNCIALGLPALVCKGAVELFKQEDMAKIDVEAATVAKAGGGAVLHADPLSPHLIDTLKAGGIMSLLKQ